MSRRGSGYWYGAAYLAHVNAARMREVFQRILQAGIRIVWRDRGRCVLTTADGSLVLSTGEAVNVNPYRRGVP